MFETFLAKADFVGTGMEMPYTVLIGIAAVFTGLICIVLLCKIVGLICGKAKKEEKPAPAVEAPKVQAAVAELIENRQQIIAAVSAAVAEELGTDVSAIRILSFKKI